MIDKIKEHLKVCPYVSDYKVTAEFLGEENCLGVFSKSAPPVVEQYADGGSLRQIAFYISVRSKSHMVKPSAICEFFYRVGNWLENSTELPALGEGLAAQRFEVVKNGAMAQRHYGTNRYDMDCRLIYYAEKGSEV